MTMLGTAMGVDQGRAAKWLSDHGWCGADVSTRAEHAPASPNRPSAAHLTGAALGGALYRSCHCRAAGAAERHGQRPAAADCQLVAALAGPRAGGERARAVEPRRVCSRTPQARAPRRPAAATAAATTSQRACAGGPGGEGCWYAFVQDEQAAPATSGVGMRRCPAAAAAAAALAMRRGLAAPRCMSPTRRWHDQASVEDRVGPAGARFALSQGAPVRVQATAASACNNRPRCNPRTCATPCLRLEQRHTRCAGLLPGPALGPLAAPAIVARLPARWQPCVTAKRSGAAAAAHAARCVPTRPVVLMLCTLVVRHR